MFTFISKEVLQDTMTQILNILYFLPHPGIVAVCEDGDVTIGNMFDGIARSGTFTDHISH